MFASLNSRNRAACLLCPAAAALASLTAVTFFVGLLGIGFLPAEARRLLNQRYVSVTHCIDMGAGRPLVSLFWTIERNGMLGWQHHVAIHPPDNAAPSIMRAMANLKPLALANGPDADHALVGDWDGSIYTLDVQRDDTELVRLGQQTDGAVVALSSSPDGQWVLSQGAFHLHAWNVHTQSEQWRRADVSPYCFALRPDSSAAIIGNSRGELIEIDLESGQTLRTLGLVGDALLVIGLSTDGDKLAVLRADGGLALLGSHTGSLLWETQPRRTRIAAGRIVSFSPCGTLLVTAGEEDSKSLSVWSVASGERIRELHGHENVVIGAAFADSGLLRSWGADGTIRTWNLKTGVATQVATICPPSEVTS